MTFTEEQIQVASDYVQRPLNSLFTECQRVVKYCFFFTYQIGEKTEYAQTVKTYIITVFLEINNRFVTP